MTGLRITISQRLSALEREVAVLHDTVKLLHKMLREHREMINDYVVQKVAETDLPANAGNNAPAKGTKELFAFVCRQKFDKIEKDLGKLRKLSENLRFGTQAG